MQTTQEFTEKVLLAYSQIENPRTKKLVHSLIKHLHGFITENRLTNEEWEYTWKFLTRMAEMIPQGQNEFILAADVLGLSQLIELMNHSPEKVLVGHALLGPFYRANAPWRNYGASIASDDTDGERVIIKGYVLDEKKQPIVNAVLDVWQAAKNGLYENQDST